MKPGRRTEPFRTALARPESFVALAHSLSITCVAEGRWTVSVDGGPASRTFGTQVEAWEAGVRAADHQDRMLPASSP
jgi:hypothetical protein